jgi:hypothetical protein
VLSVCKGRFKRLTLPQDPQVLASPLIPAPHFGQSLWKLTRTVVDCILNIVGNVEIWSDLEYRVFVISWNVLIAGRSWRGKVGLIYRA